VTAYLRPSSLDEALAARAAHPDYQVLAGGTDLLVAGAAKPAPVGILDVFGLEPLRAIEPMAEGGFRLGAATTYLDILGSEQLREALPILHAAVREIGALQIQARGTLGGNLVTSSPVGDTLPVWLALDAEIELASARGVRRVPYREFCTGYRQTALGADELVTAVLVPPLAPAIRQFWRKVGTRRAQSISKLMVAATARVEGGRIVEPRIGLGAVADRPIRGTAVEEVLAGGQPSLALAERAREALIASIEPIDDVRSRAAYRRRVAGNLVYRFARSLEASP
jgi:xanthine dehydrogenase small subunit